MSSRQMRQQRFQIVGLRDYLAQFLKQGLKVLFGPLLAKKTHDIMAVLRLCGGESGDSQVAFGFSHPLPRLLGHGGLSLGRRFRARTSRLPPVAGAGSPAYGQSNPSGNNG